MPENCTLAVNPDDSPAEQGRKRVYPNSTQIHLAPGVSVVIYAPDPLRTSNGWEARLEFPSQDTRYANRCGHGVGPYPTRQEALRALMEHDHTRYWLQNGRYD